MSEHNLHDRPQGSHIVRTVAFPEPVRSPPALVVEDLRGGYVVLIDDDIDPERHLPLAPPDAELLVDGAARARFGRREDDVLTLTPGASEDQIMLVDLDAAEFADIPVVSRAPDGTLTWHRAQPSPDLEALVRRELDRRAAEPGERFGVLTNSVGECVCVAAGTPLPPHEDIRHQTLMATTALLEGATSLAGAGHTLRSLAAQLSAAEEAGWRLEHPVRGGLAVLERPRGRR